MTNNFFTEQCIPPGATSPDVTFSPLRTSSPKSKGTTSKNFMPQADKINHTKISKNMSENLLEGNKHSSSSKPKSSIKFKAKLNIFSHRKSEIQAEFQELLWSEKDDSAQPAT